MMAGIDTYGEIYYSQIYLKWNGCGNEKIQEWVDMDTVKSRDWLISQNRDKADYRSFEL